MILDTLEILIEADKTGLESQLKSAGRSITSFVDSMNAQEVNWTSILSKTISPAIITGIASTFAMAIVSATNFQNSMVTASQNSQTAFANNQGQITDAVRNISNSTGVAAVDVASGMGKLVQLFGKDTPTAIAAMNGAAQLASITGMDLGQVISLLIPIFDNWGINTVPGVTNAMTDLFEASKTGKVNFEQLAEAAANTGVALRDKTSLKDTVYQVEQLSNQAGMTAAGTVSAFEKIANAMKDPLSNLVVLSGGLQKLTKDINRDGIVAAFQDVTNVIKGAGAAGVTLGTQMGLDTDAIKQLQTQSDKTFASVKSGALEAQAASKGLNEEFQQSLTFTKELGILWNIIFNALGKLNLDIGKFIQDLANANSMKDIVGILGGGLNPNSTPAIMPGLQTFGSQNINTNLPAPPSGSSSAKGGAPSNNSMSNTFIITAPAGGSSQVGDSIASSLYNMYQGAFSK